MKKTIVTLVILLLSSIYSINAQSFIATPADSIESTNDINDWLSDYIYIQNTSGSTLNLSFQTITNTMDPIGWTVLLCTSNGCYSYVPTAGSFGTILNGDSAHLNLHCGFVGIAGTAEIKIKVYETGNPSNSIIVTYRYHAISASRIFENTGNNELSLSQNFPNPFSGSTTIKYNLEITNGVLIITDVLGKIVSENTLNNTIGEIRVGENLLPGIYFYSLYDRNKLISKNKMIVR